MPSSNIFYCILFPFFALSMDIDSGDEIVMSQLFPKYIEDNHSACNHDTICALALVNKKWNEIIQKTSVPRRKYFTSQQDYKDTRAANRNIYQQQVWHKNNSAYAYWIKTYTKIQFCLMFLGGENKIGWSIFEDNSLTILFFEDHRPFFNAQGNACCHAWSSSELVEISLSTKKLPKTRRCILDLGKHSVEQNRKYCIWNRPDEPIRMCPGIIKEYPILLKAFINSKQVKENDDEKIYHVKGVELDEDYLLHGKFPSTWWKDKLSQKCIIKK